MNALDLQIWTAAWAVEFGVMRDEWRRTNGASKPHGARCSRVADQAVRLLRESFADEFADYLPLVEGYPSP